MSAPYYKCKHCGIPFYGWSFSDHCSACGGKLVPDEIVNEEELQENTGGAEPGNSSLSFQAD